MTLVNIVVTLTKARRKGGRLTSGIQMRYIAEAGYPKACNTFPPFLRNDGRNRRRQSAHTMPQHHRRYVNKVRKQHALNAEVAKHRYRVVACLPDLITSPVTLITVYGQEAYQVHRSPICIRRPHSLHALFHCHASYHYRKIHRRRSNPEEASPTVFFFLQSPVS